MTQQSGDNTSLSKDKIRILLLEGVHENAVNFFNANGYTNIEYVQSSLTGDALHKAISQAHFIGLRSRTQLTEEVLDHAKKLIGIGCFCIGTNQVNLQAATLRGIPVFNAPFSNTRSVAELVLAQAIFLMRGIPEKNALAHRKIWQKEAKNSFEIRGKVLGIIGYGNIGSQLSVLAESLGMQVIFYDVLTKLPLGNAEQVTTLKELFQRSDVASLHVPETAATQNMIGEPEFAMMREGLALINASRGSVIDIPALVQALESQKIRGAAIDVFPTEPKSNDEPFENPLTEFDNVILTPHIGGSTLEAQANIGIEVADKLVRYSDNGSTLGSVNCPEVGLPKQEGTHRLLHIHKNIPGVLGEINQIFSDNSINIAGQYLQTNEHIGYVVIEVNAAKSETAFAKLQTVKGTIKTRLLF